MSVNLNYAFSNASSADQLRYLLSTVDKRDNRQVNDSIDYLAAKYDYRPQTPPQMPSIDDLLRVIQSTENMNQQLVNENRFLKDEIAKCKTSAINLVQENAMLHSELKNVTVHEIIAEFQNEKAEIVHNEAEAKLRQKTEELHQSQLLINDLQKKLNAAINNIAGSSKDGKKAEKQLDMPDIQVDNTLCSKCAGINDLIAKNEEIDRLKRELDHANKTISFLKGKNDEVKSSEAESLVQIKKYVDLVKHLEMERDQAIFEKDQFKNDKQVIKTKIDDLIYEYDKKLENQKNEFEIEFDKQKKSLMEQLINAESIVSKDEAIIDRLTREKVSLSNELEDMKNKFNMSDLDKHQIMTEKLQNQYRELLKERDLLLHENKRVRHDYDLYVKQNDQDKFCLRDELMNTRNRLLKVESELLSTKEQCIKITEENNKLEAEIISCKHAKETIENSRDQNLKVEIEKNQKREIELTASVLKLQNLHCMKTKELQDIIDMQQNLLDKLKSECKSLTQHIEKTDLRSNETITQLNIEVDELKARCKKYEERSKDFENENLKHSNLHDRMKARLQELTKNTQEQHNLIQKLSASEHKLKLSNQQLVQDLATARQQLAIFAIPSKMKMIEKTSGSLNNNNDIQSIRNTLLN